MVNDLEKEVVKEDLIPFPDSFARAVSNLMGYTSTEQVNRPILIKKEQEKGHYALLASGQYVHIPN